MVTNSSGSPTATGVQNSAIALGAGGDRLEVSATAIGIFSAAYGVRFSSLHGFTFCKRLGKLPEYALCPALNLCGRSRYHARLLQKRARPQHQRFVIGRGNDLHAQGQPVRSLHRHR